MLDALKDGTLVVDVRSPRDNLREAGLGAPASVPQERWITRGNSSDRQPAYAPDNKSILFTSNRSGNLDLWTIATDGGTVRRITDDGAEDWDPAFTPDGKKIVWSSGRSGNLEIWIANADGSDAKQISHDGVDAENPTGTPDGWIVYCSFNPDRPGIWKVRPDGTQATQFVKARMSLPEVSPDGRYVSYLSDGRTPRAAVRVARVSDGAGRRHRRAGPGHPPHQRHPRPHALDAGRQVDRLPAAERGGHERHLRAGLRPRPRTRPRRAARWAASTASAPPNRSASRRTAPS